MYYAACCCGSGAVCGCGDYTYASVSFALASRDLDPVSFENDCDRICARNRYNTTTNTLTKYTEAKVFMRCGNNSSFPGTYRSTDIGNQFQTFDPDSIKVLETVSDSRFNTFRAPNVPNCCDPPGNICFDTGQITDIRTVTGSLLPFDPVDPQPFTAGMNPSASTYVARGDSMVGSIPEPFRDRIEPNTFYRKTSCRLVWSLMMRVYIYNFDPFFGTETSVSDVLSPYGGSGFLDNVHEITQVSEVGNECDSHAIGTNVVTYGASGYTSSGGGLSGGLELPAANYYINVQEDFTCPAQSYNRPCCESDGVFPETSGTRSFLRGIELDGGIFSLEFMDEPPPPAP